MVKELDKIITPPVESPQELGTDTDTEQAVRDDRDEERKLQKKKAELEAELEEERKRRDLSEEKCFFGLRIVAACLTAIVAIAVVVVYWWHILGPECWRWLDPCELDRIERMTATIIVGIVATLSVSFLLKKH